MAGTPGNPNHDPKTGRFASKSGLNKSNSTITQRGKARVQEHISAGKAFALGAAGVAVAGVGAAVLQGVTRPVRVHSQVLANKAIHAGISKTEQLVAHHGPKIAAAVAAKGSSILNHVKNMKNYGAFQHATGNSNSVTNQVKPRVRVPMGRAIAPVSPKPSAPKRSAAPKPRAPSRRK